jgi:type II secretory pathway component GspD/PulD (secretin)
MADRESRDVAIVDSALVSGAASGLSLARPIRLPLFALRFFLILLFATSVAWAQSLEVIELKYRTAEEVIPILQPLVESGGALSGRDYTLFVRTSASNLAQLKGAVEQIDRKPRQLLVSVRKSTAEELQREGIDVSGTVQRGRSSASVNEPSGTPPGVSVRGTSQDHRSSAGGISTVSVMEGASAFISSGTSVPIVTSVIAGGGRRPWAGTSTEYRDLTSGFLVTPRVSGDGVVLDIDQREEKLQNGAIRNQNLTTQISARLGEWIRLGGIEESASSTQRGVLSRQYSTNSQSQSVWVKVELQ